MHKLRSSRKQIGFTLIEVMVSMIILAIGVLSIAGYFAQGLNSSYQTQIQYIAQQKAQEAMETIFTARDTKVLTWAQIANVSKGGVFKDGAQMLCAPGTDGLFGTADDDTTTPDTIVIGPGADGIFGTADDKVLSLDPWMKRTIAISPDPSTPNLNIITITINWNYVGKTSSYTLTSRISNFS
jgi:prepilin-type N-terminal cleavage/methylation domain-containing protein